MDRVIRVHILDEINCISHSTNILTNLVILPPTIGK